jgi:hypothetical protein
VRQAALKVFGTSGGINELFKLRSRMLQEMSGAILAAYIEKHRSPPSPAKIQHMRQIVLRVWDDIAGTKSMGELRDDEERDWSITTGGGGHH